MEREVWKPQLLTHKSVPKYKCFIINGLDNFFIKTCSILIHRSFDFDTIRRTKKACVGKPFVLKNLVECPSIFPLGG